MVLKHIQVPERILWCEDSPLVHYHLLLEGSTIRGLCETVDERQTCLRLLFLMECVYCYCILSSGFLTHEVCHSYIPGDVHCCSVWSGISENVSGLTVLATQWQLTWKTFILKLRWEEWKGKQSCCVGRVEGCRPLLSFSCLTFAASQSCQFSSDFMVEVINFWSITQVYSSVNCILQE
jgi:hypothetical protein